MTVKVAAIYGMFAKHERNLLLFTMHLPDAIFATCNMKAKVDAMTQVLHFMANVTKVAVTHLPNVNDVRSCCCVPVQILSFAYPTGQS